MIITVRVKLIWGVYFEDDWECEIELDQNSTLEELHLLIQHAVNFDMDHMYEFYISRTERSHDRKNFEPDYNGCLETKINEVFPLPKNKKLFYWFDYGDDWKFQITKSRKKEKEAEVNVRYPKVVSEKGIKPEQYPASDD